MQLHLCLPAQRAAYNPQVDKHKAELMKKAIAAATPDAYVASLKNWQKETVERIRLAVLSSGKLNEVIKWGHLVYLYDGPVALIRSEEQRVLFGFWRGQRLQEMDLRLKAGGKYEMATIVLIEGDDISSTHVKKLVKAAIALNQELGDPTLLSR
ncbi:MAG: hypothetical protein K0Q78_1964 [Cellvibrio sp.]|nr:hypothetical protein [Cellvibrio sp.]